MSATLFSKIVFALRNWFKEFEWIHYNFSGKDSARSKPERLSYVLIEVGLRVSVRQAYYSHSHLQGCQLELVSQEVKSYGEDAFDYSMTGRTYVQPGTLLAFWIEDGEFAGQEHANYWLVQVDPNEKPRLLGYDPHKYLKGKYKILAYGKNDRAERLRKWWLKWAPTNGGQTVSVARWLGQQIKRGYETPQLYPKTISTNPNKMAGTFNPVTGWKFENVTPEQLRRFGEWFR